ncbi:mechanosensitive ion channel domain-containing protein [Desulfocastanea catecholica]
MRWKFVCRCVVLFLFIIVLFLLPLASQSEEAAPAQAEISLENASPEEIALHVAKLNDEQVRSLLMSGLQKEANIEVTDRSSQPGLFSFVVNWLHLVDMRNDKDMESRLQSNIGDFSQLPSDLANTIRIFSEHGSGFSTWGNLIMILFAFLVGFAAASVYKAATITWHRQLRDQAVPELGGWVRFWAGFLYVLPSLITLIIFGAFSLLTFLLSPPSSSPPFCLLFMAILFVISFCRLVSIVSSIVFAPRRSSLRLLNIEDTAALNLKWITQILFSYAGIAYCVLALCKELGLADNSFVLLTIMLGSLFLLLVAYFIMRNRFVVASHMLSSQSSDGQRNWLARQLAPIWYIPALLYLFAVWVNFLYLQVSETGQENSALLLSMLAVPLFLVFDRIGQWFVRTVVSVLHTQNTVEKKQVESGQLDSILLSHSEKEQLLISRVSMVVRIAILFAMTIWVLTLWGYKLPYATAITRAVFESLVTVALALFFWRIASAYIERKIKEMSPETSDKNESEDCDWGGAAQRGRSYTLLPMARKFIGTVLVVMVSMIILSAIGVNIGPLLAGAGVVGLAVGFGAQKLVSDVLSGFFYLLDDAFRVGEYVEAGGLSGAIEKITLRNVMLRHHRGMLQIVPYSDLGPITNFMRGGLVVKFNLEFPYDTNVDQVRKVIKKVGQELLEEEEYKNDFIHPIKSQGVREITNSVMTIRVKFTAKPGAHFLIRREAYRRITEALMAKGIHYAHRKIIVELPQDTQMSKADQKKYVEAGAAAGLAAMDEGGKSKES